MFIRFTAASMRGLRQDTLLSQNKIRASFDYFGQLFCESVNRFRL
jgi:hypothetical protein